MSVHADCRDASPSHGFACLCNDHQGDVPFKLIALRLARKVAKMSIFENALLLNRADFNLG